MFKRIVRKIGKIFSKHSIPYIIIGGQAVLLYGEPRLTKGIDITIGLGVDQFEHILEITSDIDLTPIPKDVQAFVNRTMVLPLIDGKSQIRVDIIFSFSLFEKEAIGRAKVIEIEGVPVHYASLEDLLIFKVFSGRPRDMEDVKVLLIKNRDCDKEYIKMKLKELSFAERDLCQEFESVLETL